MTRTAKIEIYGGKKLRSITYAGGETEEEYWPGTEFRWRFRSSNGRIIAQSSEGYRRIRDVVRSIELTWPGRVSDPAGNWAVWLHGGGHIPIIVPEGATLNSRRSR